MLTPSITLSDSTFSTPAIFTTYQWYRDGSPIAGATNASYLATDTGSYYVYVTDSGGCAGSSSIDYLSNLATDNIDNSTNEITISPNPTQKTITISAQICINDVAITDLIGREVYYSTYNSRKVVVSMEQFPPGVYFVKVNGSSIFKVVRE